MPLFRPLLCNEFYLFSLKWCVIFLLKAIQLISIFYTRLFYQNVLLTFTFYLSKFKVSKCKYTEFILRFYPFFIWEEVIMAWIRIQQKCFNLTSFRLRHISLKVFISLKWRQKNVSNVLHYYYCSLDLYEMQLN